MKTVLKDWKNILWLCKPYCKCAKLYLFLSACVFTLRSPIDDIIYVRSPEVMINLLSNGKSFSYIIGVAIIICTISFLNDVSLCVFHPYFTQKEESIKLKLNYEIYKKAVQLDYKYIDSPTYYDNYAWAIQEYAGQTKSAREFMVDFLKNLMSITVLVSIVASIDPWILLLEIGQMALHTAINTQMNKINIRKKQELIPLNRRLNYFQRLFYIKDYSADMKVTLLNKTIFDRFTEIGEKKVNVETRYAKTTAISGGVHDILFVITEFIIMLYLVNSIITGHIPEVGMYMTMMLAFYRLDSKLYAFVDLFKQANALSLDAEKIKAFFEMKSVIESDGQKCLEMDEGSLHGGNISLELRNVSFSYENSDFALSNLNIRIKAGEKIAIVGENGAGKSTLMKLLLRLYDVQSGEILINDRNIKTYNVQKLRSIIGVAFQNTNIYAMNLAENIAIYGHKSEKEISEIIERTGLNAIFEKNNIDSCAELTREFDKNGVILSGGEAQKVALARVLNGEFGLLLLDEPSSALDPIAEFEMCQLILSAANKATTIIVAHRLATIRNMDRIILVDKGMIKEIGTHDELMQLQGKYFEMFSKQAQNYIN